MRARGGAGRAAALVAALVSWLSAAPTPAHPLAPALLELQMERAREGTLRFKQPLQQPRGSRLAPRWPDSCHVDGDPEESLEGSGVVRIWHLRCDREWEGGRIGAEGLGEPGVAVVLRLVFPDGTSHQSLLRADRPEATITGPPPPAAVLGRYAGLGIEHLLRGPDHLLFLLGLLLLVHGARTLVATITAFTVGHSVTLALATLGWVTWPQAPVEVAIAASLVAVAAAVLARDRGGDPSFARRPWAVAGAFGLLHGLGFAGALREVGLPAGELLLALLGFNLGIEVAQLAVAAALLAVGAGLDRGLRGHPAWRVAGRRLAAHAIGIPAGFWIWERGVPWLSPGPWL